MDHSKLNKPFAAYVLTQSCLVVIVLAASFIVTHLLSENFGVEISRMTISIWLVILSQLPTAMLYATREARTLTSAEGWIFGFTFVVITLVCELALQALAGQAWPKIDLILNLLMASDWQLLFIGACGLVLGVIMAAFTFKTLFRFSVRNNLEGEAPEPDLGWLEKVASVKPRNAIRKFRRLRQKRNNVKLFRHVLIGSNLAVFALSFIVFGPEFLEILTLSIPLSIFFTIIIVANNLAKTAPNATILKRCWDISIEIFPITVTSFLLLGLSNIYLAYLQTHGQDSSIMTDMSAVFLENNITPSDILLAATNLATFFAACLFANAGLLLLFTRLIKPLVIRANAIRRPASRPLNVARMAPVAAGQGSHGWTPRSPEILAVVARTRGSARNLQIKLPVVHAIQKIRNAVQDGNSLTNEF